VSDVQRRFRFGVLAESVTSAEGLLATARRAEDFGYSTLLLRDHFVTDPFGAQFAPLVALAVAAAATTRLRVGTLVLDNDYRHPVLLAKEAATLDALSVGRFELGIGAGWLRDEYTRAGLPFEAPGVRVGRLEESLRILKGLFAGSPLTFSGAHYSITDLDSFPRPVQRPHPPILIGAGGQRMLGLAGREADIVGILPKALPNGTISEDLSERSAATTERKIDGIRQAAGSRFDRLELSAVISVTVADDYRAAAEQVAVDSGWGAAAADLVLDMPSRFVGPVDRIAEQMLARRDRFGFSYHVISDTDLDAFAPVVGRLAGR